MVNTAILRYKVEPIIRAGLETEFAQRFTSQVLALPGGAVREFDAQRRPPRRGQHQDQFRADVRRKHPSGKINGCIADLYYLSLLDSPVRRLVLTNPQFHEIFTKRIAGALPQGVEVELVSLPAELQAEVDDVIRRASDEIDRGKAAQEVAAAIEEEVEGNPGVRPS